MTLKEKIVERTERALGQIAEKTHVEHLSWTQIVDILFDTASKGETSVNMYLSEDQVEKLRNEDFFVTPAYGSCTIFWNVKEN